MHTDGVALLGGSFNPIHIGHLVAARTIAEQLPAAQVIFIPAVYPPHKWPHELAAAEHRMEMARLAVAGEPQLAVSDIEVQLGGMKYAIDSVEAYRSKLGPDLPLHWIIGGDTLLEIPRWHRIREMADMCRIITVVRPGFEAPDLSFLAGTLSPEQVDRLRASIIPTPHVDISSTEIRRRIRERRSIRWMVPDAVYEYIHDYGLYRSA